jgi:carbonic anhydrase/acetyltransferase-like protein (isoleucine patch superfamily)
MIYEFLGRSPRFDDTVFVAPSADVIGDVTLGSESSVWFNTTIRGDVNWIEIGARTNVQDNVCIHVMNQIGPTLIGAGVSIGHNAMVHGCTIHDNVLIGIQSTVLDQAVIESDVVLAAGSLVPPGKILKSGWMYMGSPAKPVRELTARELEMIRETAEHYVTYSRAYRRIDHYEVNPFYTDLRNGSPDDRQS